MRRSAAIILILCMVLPMTASYTWLTVEKYRLKKLVQRELLHGVDRESLQVLAFDLDEAGQCLHWEHSHEFEYCGQMYDVVETWVEGDSVYYRCWPDDEETALNAQLDKLIDAMMQKDLPSDGRVKWQDVFKLTYDRFDCIWEAHGLSVLTKVEIPYIFLYRSVDLLPDSPPPRRG